MITQYRRKFDFVITRAVGKLEVIIDWTKLLIKQNAKIILLKGGDLSEEINAVKTGHQKFKVKEIDLLGVPYFKEEGKEILIYHFDWSVLDNSISNISL